MNLPASLGLRPHDSLPAIGWCADSREDPITGLVAFPDFHMNFPKLLQAALAAGEAVGLAIGDVDNLKAHVESANESDPFSFGHLAGNIVMTRLGQVARTWFWQHASECGLVSTFGGDEVIVAMILRTPASFMVMLRDLRRRLNAALPCTVSFAGTVIQTPSPGPAEHIYLQLMTGLDRCLFNRKTIRRATSTTASFLMELDLPRGTSRDASDE